jgi:5,5'-dehydrodivanillate O-demethylase
MLSREENEFLTRVGPGTPAGELLRRYWHPVAVAGELTEEKPIKAVKILDEELVVFRDKTGRYGLVGEHCPHRSASLAFGRVDQEGIRCPYHGWKFDGAGKCLEQPAEPEGSTFKERTRHRAYLLEKLGGLLFAYMGPEPKPLLPRWDVLAWENGKRWIVVDSLLDCNWLQPMENSVDPSHLFWLHGDSGHLVGHMPDYQETHEYIRFRYGIIKRRITPGRKAGDPPLIDEHPLVFPTTLRHVARHKTGGFRHNVQIRVPVDDTHTQVYRVSFVPSDTERSPADQDPPFEFCALKTGPRQYSMDLVSGQDAMAWETQGPITDRTREHLGAGDEGVILLRKILKEQIEIVQKSGEPIGLVRSAEENRLIDLDVVNERIGLVRSKTPSVEEKRAAS